MANQSPGVLVVDFGAQYAQLIARRVREAHVYSEIVPSTITAAEVTAKNPEAIILSGGPASVYAENAPTIDPAIFALGIPTFGICYGFQVMANARTRAASAHKAQPCWVGCSDRGGDHFDHIAVGDFGPQWHRSSVDLGGCRVVAHIAVDSVGKVDHRSAAWHCHDAALGREHIDRVGE